MVTRLPCRILVASELRTIGGPLAAHFRVASASASLLHRFYNAAPANATAHAVVMVAQVSHGAGSVIEPLS
jgi:hypothetical protein